MALFAEPTKKREDSIDLIRALSIIGVLVWHYTTHLPDHYLNWTYKGITLPYGYIGVQAFFIVSGYCIYLTITHSKSLSDFFAKRISRLWPALIVAATVTYIFVHIFGLPGRAVNTLKYISNLLFLNVISERYVDSVYWTITTEVKFYLWFGLFYFLDKTHIARWWSAFSLVSLAVGILGLSVSYYPTLSAVMGFIGDKIFIFPHAAWFLIGIIIYEWNTTSWKQKAVLFIPVFITLAFTGYTKSWLEMFLLILATIACIALIPLKGLSIPAPVRFIGLVSYPLYLVHQNVGYIIIREFPGVDPYVRLLIAISTVVGVAAIIHYGIEWRFRRRFYTYIRKVLDPLSRVVIKRFPSLERFTDFPLS
ncbi:acyltransferase [Candidatus Kaiserbacteria bacterium]|nr:acyltransferase [Candidatus Kaiserbacteria bacterium]